MKSPTASWARPMMARRMGDFTSLASAQQSARLRESAKAKLFIVSPKCSQLTPFFQFPIPAWNGSCAGFNGLSQEPRFFAVEDQVRAKAFPGQNLLLFQQG